MKRRAIFSLGLGLLLAATCQTPATASSPSLGNILPRGVQRGTETILSFNGGNLVDAKEILFYSPGFTVTKIEPAAGTVKATIKIAPEARLGEHIACVRTAGGVSEYRTFYVGALPDVAEKEPNTEFTAPQPISLNVTVSGGVDNEDVDYYVVEAKKGQRISAEVEGMRLGVTMFDPYVAILDAKRFELVAADDTPLVKQDAAASIVAPEDGKYYIQIRESSYGGNGSCYYRLHVGAFPRPLAVFPAGGKKGDQVDVKYLGDPTGEIVQKITVPSEIIPNYGLFCADAAGIAPSDIPFRQSEHGNVLEKEPNNALAEATPAELPLALNGILQTPGDVDYYKFAGKKDQVFEVECFGRRIRSAIDPVMTLHNAQGQAIASNDDSRGPDAYFRWQIPADGEYVLSVSDHLLRGGPTFVYRVEFLPVKPVLTVGIPRVARYSQERQQIFVAKGNRYATLMSVSRENFGGDVILDPKDLPAGLKMIADAAPANLGAIPVMFEAAADAPVAGKLIDFQSRHADPTQKISGGFSNRADFVIAAPGQSLYSWCDVTQVPVVVVDELPFKLEIVEPKVPLVQSGSMQLKIVAQKKAGWDESINVQLPFLPPGVGSVPAVDIPKGQTSCLFPLNAASNAELKKWKLFALGQSNVNGAAWVSSQMANLEVAPPYVQIAMQRGAVEQGNQTDLLCTVTVAKPFEGAAKVQLMSLPPKVTAPELQLTKDAKDLVFKLATDKTSPAGTHKNIFCQVVVTENNEPITHFVGSSELRIDQPLPAPTTPAPQPTPMPVAKAEAAKPAEPKRLTRLEQLRLDAQTKAGSAAAATK